MQPPRHTFDIAKIASPHLNLGAGNAMRPLGIPITPNRPSHFHIDPKPEGKKGADVRPDVIEELFGKSFGTSNLVTVKTYGGGIFGGKKVRGVKNQFNLLHLKQKGMWKKSTENLQAR